MFAKNVKMKLDILYRQKLRSQLNRTHALFNPIKDYKTHAQILRYEFYGYNNIGSTLSTYRARA